MSTPNEPQNPYGPQDPSGAPQEPGGTPQYPAAPAPYGQGPSAPRPLPSSSFLGPR